MNATNTLTDIEPVLTSLRAELAAIIEAVRPPVRRPVDLERATGLDKSLCWSVYDAVNSRGAGTIATRLPGPKAMASFFEGVRAIGVPEDVVRRASEAFSQLERLAARHADDRSAFGLLVSDLDDDSDGAAAAIDARNKRSSYRANSLLVGRQAAATVAVFIEHPSAVPGLVDRVLINGLHNVRRTRRGAPLRLEQSYRRIAGPGEPRGPAGIEPLDPREPEVAGMALVRDFCSHPLSVQRIGAREGSEKDMAVMELSEQGLGASAEVTFFLGRILRAVATPPNFPPGDDFNSVLTVQCPTALYVQDVFFHKTLWDDRIPEVSTYLLRSDGSLDLREEDRLPMRERAELLGWGIECARTTTLPRHAELLRYAFERTGWDPAEFRAFRVKVEHPLLLSRIRVRFRKA